MNIGAAMPINMATNVTTKVPTIMKMIFFVDRGFGLALLLSLESLAVCVASEWRDFIDGCSWIDGGSMTAGTFSGSGESFSIFCDCCVSGFDSMLRANSYSSLHSNKYVPKLS